jgi:hypothetical protein
VPKGLVAVVGRAMARLPSDRYASAVEVLRALTPYGALAAEKADVWTSPIEPAPLDPDEGVHARATVPVAFPAMTPSATSGKRRSLAPRPTTSRPPPRPSPAPLRQDAATTAAVAHADGLPSLGELAVPRPRTFLAVPTVFDAESRDWQERPNDAAVGTVRSTPGRPIATARPTPVASTPLEVRRPGDLPRIKAAFVSTAIDHLREVHGSSGLDRILAEVSPESGHNLRGVLMPVAWMPASVVGELALASEAVFGHGGHERTIELGKAVATRALSTTHRHFTQGATPTMAVQRLPKIWRTYHNGGDVVVVRSPNGRWQVEVGGNAPPTLVHANVMMGFYVGLLELTGAREVHAELLGCPELGAPRTTTELRWR